MNRWNYTQSNPVNYTDPSGNYCVAGFDIDILGGEKCTQEDKQQAAQQIKVWQKNIKSVRNFQLGFMSEILLSLTVGGPELTQYALDVIKSMPAYEATGIILNTLLCGNKNAALIIESLNRATNNITGDPWFNQGRVYGRFTALALGGAAILTGAASWLSSKPAEVLFIAAGGPTGGLSLAPVAAIEAIDAGLIIYGGAIVASVVARSWNDNLFARFAAGEFNSGGGGGGIFGGNGTRFTSKTFWTSKNGKVRLDAENPNPGKRPGNIHIQDKSTGGKYYYDPESKIFSGLPTSLEQDLFNDRSFLKALSTALRYMGE